MATNSNCHLLGRRRNRAQVRTSEHVVCSCRMVSERKINSLSQSCSTCVGDFQYDRQHEIFCFPLADQSNIFREQWSVARSKCIKALKRFQLKVTLKFEFESVLTSSKVQLTHLFLPFSLLSDWVSEGVSECVRAWVGGWGWVGGEGGGWVSDRPLNWANDSINDSRLASLKISNGLDHATENDICYQLVVINSISVDCLTKILSITYGRHPPYQPL